MKLLKWFETRKQRIKHDQYASGFDYALGALARGEKTPFALDVEQDSEQWNLFDLGMDDATRLAIKFGIVKDDRF